MLTAPLSPCQFFIAFVLAMVGSIIQGSIGFGMAALTAPILLLVNPIFVPGPIMLPGVLLVSLLAYRERKSVVMPEVVIGVLGYMLGAIPAVCAISKLPESSYQLLFATLVILGVGVSLAGWRFALTPHNLFGAAVFSGFAGTAAGIGGPFVALVYQYEKGPRIRGTMSTIFAIGTVVALVGLHWSGHFGIREILLGMWLIPGVILGFFVSQFTNPFIDKAHTRPAVLAISLMAAIAIFVRVLIKNS